MPGSAPATTTLRASTTPQSADNCATTSRKTSDSRCLCRSTTDAPPATAWHKPKLAATNARLDEEEARKSLYKEIQSAYYAAVTSRHKWEAAQVADSAAVTAAQLAQKKYEAGKGTYVDYDEARNKQTNAAVDRITAYYEARYRQDVMDFYAGKMLK